MMKPFYCSRCLTTFGEDGAQCPNLGCRSPRPPNGWGRLLADGEVLDRHYLILRRLATGGAGVTYLARELGPDDQPVGPKLAIKVLYAQRDQGAFLRRLSNEAQILLELAHPHIVTIRGFVQRAGHSPYLVTRFEEGGSLLDHLRRAGPMDLRQVAAMGVQLCEALERAHHAGVIHRDLKPENILLTHVPAAGEVPTVKLTDFGIAKVHGGLNTKLTRVGAFVGTPQYAAPEQFSGHTPTTAADVYAIAAVLLFCITLRPVLGGIDMSEPDEMVDRLYRKLPPNLDIGKGDAADVASFNAFLTATMSFEPDHRVPIGQATQMLRDVAAGVPVRAPVPAEGSHTHVPEHDPELEPVPSDVPASPSSDDTFKGILSQQDGEPQPGQAAHKSTWIPEVSADLDPEELEKTEAVRPDPAEVTEAMERTEATELVQKDPPPSPEQDAPPKKKSKLPLLLGVVALLGLVGLGGAAGVAFLMPELLPVEARGVVAPAHALGAQAPEAASVLSALQAAEGQLSKGCPAGAGTVELVLEFEASGALRRVVDIKAADPAAGRCVAQNALGLSIPRSGEGAIATAYRLRL